MAFTNAQNINQIKIIANIILLIIFVMRNTYSFVSVLVHVPRYDVPERV
jgi:hypothetical protein